MVHRDHFAPHSSRRFEGYYTRILTEDGGTIAIIFCWVKGAKQRANLVLVLYERSSRADSENASSMRKRGTSALSGHEVPSFKYEFFPEHFDISVGEYVRGEPQAFTITAPGIGSMKVAAKTIEYDICARNGALRLHLVLTKNTPWSPSHPLRGPMGPILAFSRLLPLNWHVRSTQSTASYTLTYGSPDDATSATMHGTGRAHAEKNWGASFPKGWIWAQTFSADGQHTLCIAGGTALPGVQAYLVGYRSPVCGQWDFRPPFALGVGPFAPFVRVRHDSKQGEVEMRVSTGLRKLHVRIAADPDTFVGIPAPLKNGHQPGFAHESFRASVRVEAFRRRWPWPWAKWERVEEVVLGRLEDGTECGALEFGGAFSHEVDT
ncbi:hypothetical protein OH77DRAFT_1431738 [Trametes cingulata]|nr:hypothetical protein OH77DRAFT_1431738 [Trametes cingulata]